MKTKYSKTSFKYIDKLARSQGISIGQRNKNKKK
jgi:hypothetical protein